MKNDSKRKLVEEYKEKESLYAEFAFLIRNLLEGFLRNLGFKFQISHRSKDKNKLGNKIDKKIKEGKKYKVLDDIEDLAGVRIVFYLESDKKRFHKHFFEEFKKCIIKEEEKYDPEGYCGTHYIFCLDVNREQLIEYHKYRSLKCEIQVSTILYHGWSEVQHDIIYKPTGDEAILNSLGLDDLKKSSAKIMAEHLHPATCHLDYINKQYKRISQVGEILGADFLADILAHNNDEVHEMLEIIGEFCHKKPEETLAMLNTVINKKPLEPILLDPGFKIYGKTHKDLIMKSMELLSNIRYFKPDEVLQLLARFSLNSDKDISGKALDIAKQFTGFDYNYISQVKDYGPQRKVLDFVLAWTREEQLRYINFVETVLWEVLNPSVKGTTSGLNKETQYTLTMHFGVVSPTDFLKKMRREAIDLTYELYKAARDPKIKLRLVNIFDEAIKPPSNVAYSDDVAQMIEDDLTYLLEIYRKIIFGEKNDKMTDALGIVAAVDEKLCWINKRDEGRKPVTEKLLRDILKDDLYRLFRLLAGDPIAHREEEDWDVGEKKRHEEIDCLVKSIKKSNLKEWFDKLNKIAGQYGLVEKCKFTPFKDFLRRLAEKTPSIADDLLKMVFEFNSPLKCFAGSFLDGFRSGAHFGLWDKHVSKIIKAKDMPLANAIIFSLKSLPNADLKKLIREEDIELLASIVKGKNQFSFVKTIDDRIFEYALFSALVRNLKRSPKTIEPLITEVIKRSPKYLNMFFFDFCMATRRKWIDVEELQLKTIKFLKGKMVDLQDLDWHVQELLLAIGKKYGLEPILDVFMNRIRRDEERKKKKGWPFDDRYEAIPYHLNPKLTQFIADHQEYIKIAGTWISKMTTGWSTYNHHVGHFIQWVGKGFDEILTALIQKGDDDSLLKAARAMNSAEGAELDLCIEIVRKTDNKKIVDQVVCNIYATGCVCGEYGIAESYEEKAKALEKYQVDKEERVRNFAKRMIEGFLDSAKKERKRVYEEMQLRKIEFEG